MGGAPCDSPEEIDADIWFSDWERGGTLLEEARHFAPWDQTLTLLWFKDGEVPPQKFRNDRGEILEDDEDEPVIPPSPMISEGEGGLAEDALEGEDASDVKPIAAEIATMATSTPPVRRVRIRIVGSLFVLVRCGSCRQ